MEWNNPFNPFNSWKILYWADHWKGIPDGKIPMPVMVSIDPCNRCNYGCSFCNASKVLNRKVMSADYLRMLAELMLKNEIKATCFTGDTKIKLINGTHKTFEELANNWNKNQKPFEVYSRDENGNIVPGIAYNPRKTREVTELLELVLDNGEIIVCTSDEDFMLKDGTYKRAINLNSEDSLVPLNTKILSDGYEFIMDTSYCGVTHRLLSAYKEGKFEKLLKKELIVHHKNFNKLDNTQENLAQLTSNEHSRLHALTIEQRIRFNKARDKWNNSDKGRQQHIEQMKKMQLKYTRSKKGRKQSSLNLTKYNKSKKGRKISGEIFEKYNASERGRENSLLQFQKINSDKEIILRNNQNPDNILARQKGKVYKIVDMLKSLGLEIDQENYDKYWYNGMPKFSKAREYIYNHKVVSKKLLKFKEPISVYCMTVKKYHNFALSSGVFVKNCVGGGGEPTLNPNLGVLLDECAFGGIDVLLITNGRLMHKFPSIRSCVGVGVSMDAGTAETYARIKGVRKNDFVRTCKNLEGLTEYVDLTYKYLLWKENCYEVYEAARLAKELGCDKFQVRPASYPWWRLENGRLYSDEEFKIVNEQFDKIFELESKEFSVFGIRHKFNTDLSFERFERCWAGYICCNIQPDHSLGVCCDRRGDETVVLGTVDSVDDFNKLWGSKRHIDVVRNIDTDKCPRCTYAPHQKVFENVILSDKMMVDFI